MTIVGIYLAAGMSRRMGRNKLALPVAEITLGSLALQCALKTSLDHIYIISSCKEPDWLAAVSIDQQKYTIITCLSAHLGQAESLRCGIHHAQAHGADAAVVLLADQPFVTTAMLEQLIYDFQKAPASKFVAATYRGTIIPPVLFSASMYPDLLNLRGDTGAKALLRGAFLQQGKLLDFPEEKPFFDVDTPDDYQRLIGYLRKV